MAFQLYKAGPSSTAPKEICRATAAIAIGDPVKLVAGDSGASKANVTKITGGQDDADLVYGIAASAATADNDEIEVIPVFPHQTWIADAKANADITKTGLQTTFIGASSDFPLVVTGGTITNKGAKVVIVGYVGAVADKKVLVKFNAAATLMGSAFTS